MNSVFSGSCTSFATSRDRFKGTKKLGGGLFGARLLPSSLSPVGAVLHDPIKQCFFEADVFAGFFALNPLVFQNLGALGKELLVENRILDELRLSFFRGKRHLSLFFHEIWDQSTPNALGMAKSNHWNSTGKPSYLFSLVWAQDRGCLTKAKSYEDFRRPF